MQATLEACQQDHRPCPWVACKHHLYLDVNPETGSIKMNFPDKDSAVAFAVKHRLAYEVEEPPPRRQQRKSYADNFAFRRES